MTSATMTAGAAPNAHRLLWAGFTAILAAGVGFAIRGGILDNWGREFGFTNAQLGVIGGAGFTGFCFGIIIGGVIADKIGYGKLVVAAFAFHVLSAFVTFAAVTPTGDAAAIAAGQATAFNFLFWGTFIFAIANGTLEAVANPLVATVFPNDRTHYLNILHASWPAGMIIGAAAGWVLDDMFNVPWKYQLALFLLPTVVYGLMFLGQAMPKSEASKQGLSLGEMLKDVGLLGGLVVCYLLSLFFGDVLKPLFAEGSPMAGYVGYGIGGALLIAVGVITKFSLGSFLLFVLFVTHALVGAVELGTDGWIQNITGNILTSQEGKILFVFTSAVMFALRFCAHFIEKQMGLSPVGILLVCSILAFIGLNLTSRVDSFTMALLALTVYGFGKTFFWPTMLAVTSDRFPRTGAVAISIMGGIGMLSAGLMGSQGLGYAKDRFAGEALKAEKPALFEEYQASKESTFLFFPAAKGIDGQKLGAIQEKKPDQRTEDDKIVVAASISGDRKTLVADSAIPATMAAIYLCLMIYFKSIGGYRPLTLKDLSSKDNVHTGTDLGTAES
ncbi:Major Facilitator Superfamily protein [Planctopirus ephydatiae]|uniref:Major Facilitator Superfamily protein n=1 Tax=Planctopirus ephydatiae TaxID=2528019 RepID=A0A518GQL6_9PLAN|nr:MFS transporter [Planctopirus ephydatiae]QDV30903.1 Major Facilitator Superfamily protein [Planctopirus ephydatiae]